MHQRVNNSLMKFNMKVLIGFLLKLKLNNKNIYDYICFEVLFVIKLKLLSRACIAS